MSPSRAPEPLPILVCGEAARGDDAAGFAVISMLAPATQAAARIERVGQLDVLFLLDLPSDPPCIVVDAVSGLTPGEIWVRPLSDLVDRARARDASGRRPEPRSSHELPIDAVLALAATLRAEPPNGVFVGIGGATFALGAGLSPAVEAALPAFAAAIDQAVLSLHRPATERVIGTRLALAGTEARS